MEDFKITIPKPCHENWDNMSPNEQGKHCGVCETTVVDFTKMEPLEIKNYFEAKNGKVCGRFSEVQVSKYIPKHHQWLINLNQKIESQLNFLPFKKLALTMVGVSMAIIGCDKKPNNLLAYKHPQEISKADTVIDVIIGEIEIDTTKTTKPDTSCTKTTKVKIEEKIIMGKFVP